MFLKLKRKRKGQKDNKPNIREEYTKKMKMSREGEKSKKKKEKHFRKKCKGKHNTG